MKIFKIVFLFITVALAALFFYSYLFNWPVSFYFEFSEFEEKPIISFIETIGQEVFSPPPLEIKEQAPQSYLTAEGIIAWTNAERAKEGLSLLKESSLLNEMAQAKVADMFLKQYFAHESPLGIEVGGLAEDFGYSYILIGENLALGNFKDDQVLVQGWMDSPGHRENILNKRYSEIGIGVAKGMFEGREIWLAVQHFALPLSACPQPDQDLKETIELKQIRIDDLQILLAEKEQELRSLKRADRMVYNQKVEEYNLLAEEYNSLIQEIKDLIEQYNYQIALFNACASGSDSD
jgi:hypothetical protein